MRPERKFVLSLLACLAIAMDGCSGPSVSTTITEGPKNATASKLRRVAVLPFEGVGGQGATAEFESILAQATENGNAYFTVVDRQTVQHAMEELQFHRTGLVDDRSVAKIGSFIGAEGIYTGTVVMPPVGSRTRTETRTACPKAGISLKSLLGTCSNASRYTVSCVDKSVHVTLVPRLVEVATARVVYQPSFSATRRGSACSDGMGEVDEEGLRAAAIGDVFRQLALDVAPHERRFDLPIKTATEGMPPERQSAFQSALAFANAGRMDRACASWIDLAAGDPASLTLAFDRAVCDEARGDETTALREYQAVDRQLTKPDPDVNAALQRVEASLAHASQTRSQQQATDAVITPGAGPGEAGPGLKIPWLGTLSMPQGLQ